jgi:hypothetical protein
MTWCKQLDGELNLCDSEEKFGRGCATVLLVPRRQRSLRDEIFYFVV